MTRDELVEVAWLAYANSVGDSLADVIDAVEPLIRADERERHAVLREQLAYEQRAHLAHDNEMADLRAKVEALPQDGGGRVWRADVLALIDGRSDA